MRSEGITTRQTVYLFVLFLLGNTIVLEVNFDSKQDTWIAVIAGFLLSVAMLLIYSRTLKLFPGKNFYEIAELIFGRVGSKIFIIPMVWYSLHLASIVVCNFQEYIELVELPSTPRGVIVIPIMIVSIVIAKSKYNVLGRWGTAALVLVVSIFLISIILSLNKLQPSNLLPVLSRPFDTILNSGYKILAFPLAETVVFMTMFDMTKKNVSPHKAYIIGISIGCLLIILIVIRNLMLLGSYVMEHEYYPSYTALRIISISNFLSRIEGFISTNFILAGVTKIAICMISSAKGLAKIVNIKSYTGLIVPVGFFVLFLSFTSFNKATQMFVFLEKYYCIYAIPFQLLIPVIVWIAAEFKTRGVAITGDRQP